YPWLYKPLPYLLRRVPREPDRLREHAQPRKEGPGWPSPQQLLLRRGIPRSSLPAGLQSAKIPPRGAILRHPWRQILRNLLAGSHPALRPRGKILRFGANDRKT